jgi:hypothetical protein
MQRTKMTRVMHNYVPPNTFRATVRSRSSFTIPSITTLTDESDEPVLYSPSSFPSTPYSLAKVMSRSSDRVDNVMYIARDKLRLAESYSSDDAICRSVAREAKQSSSNGVAFDPSFVSNGLYLSSGNHCAQKLGRGICNSCRAALPVLPNVFIYFEISIMTSVDTDLDNCIAIGLAPPGCPVNVVCGTWGQSIGLNSDGSVLIASRWSSNLANTRFEPGSTIGVLVKLAPTITINAKPEQKDDIDDGDGSTDSSDDDLYIQTNPLSAIFAIGRLLGFNKQEDAVAEAVEEESSDLKQEGSPIMTPFIAFNINGTVLQFPDSVAESFRSELRELNPPLYPTVSLLAERTKVWCRFDKADIVYKSRQNIGAPKNVRVYCLDGSLLLNENDL